MTFRHSYLGFAVVLVMLSSIISCSTMAPDVDEMMDPDETDPIGTAPDFTLTSVDGGEVTLADFSGKPLVIFFFGNGCPLCISSSPKIQSKITNAFSSNDMAIIGIDTWDGNQSSVMNFRNNSGLSFDLLLEGSTVAADYSTTYDRLIVINGKGEIVFQGTSAAGKDVDKVATILTNLIN